jgi:hypothetical protein
MAGLAYNYKFHRFEPKSVEMKMTLIYTNEWKIRKFIATKLIILAATILGCGIKIEHEDTKIIYKK